ncbi:MAG: hypothetical protein M4579_003550 [Chaenotheca gracillima]|nr:MAG: hypothetical protein M4579_003550 [Chaenotheca gracillima]
MSSTGSGHGRYPKRAARSPRPSQAPIPEQDEQEAAPPAGPRDAAMPATALSLPQTFGAPVYHDPETNVGREETTAQIGDLMAPTTNIATARDEELMAMGRSPSRQPSVAPRTRASTRRQPSMESTTSYPNTRARQRRDSVYSESLAPGDQTGASRAPSKAPSMAQSKANSRAPSWMSSRAPSRAGSVNNDSPAKRTRLQTARATSQARGGVGPSNQPNVSTSFGDESGEFHTVDHDKHEQPTLESITPAQNNLAIASQHLSQRGTPTPSVHSEESRVSRASALSSVSTSLPSLASYNASEASESAKTPTSERSVATAEGQLETELDAWVNHQVALHSWRHRWAQFIGESMSAASRLLWELLTWLFMLLCVLLLGAALIRTINPRYSLDQAAWDEQVASWDSSVSGYASNWHWPSWSDLPITLTSPQDVLSDLASRMTTVEGDLTSLKTRSRLHASSIQKLEELLPERVAMSPTWDGQGQIDHAFWSALKMKIEADSWELPLGQPQTGGVDDAVVRDLGGRHWQEFLETNEERVRQAKEEGRYGVNPEGDDLVVTKSEFITILQMNSEENAARIERATGQLNANYNRLSAALDERASAVAMDVATWATNVNLKNAIPAQQLSNLASANLQAGTEVAIRKVNYFSPGLGAIVDPHLTSPTFGKEQSRVKAGIAKALNLGQRNSNPPMAALEPWSDIGDCWCSATDTGMAQVAVLLPRSIYPTEVTIDHIPRQSTLDIISAPHEIEVFAQFNDETIRRSVWEQSLARLGPARFNPNDLLDETFVRVGKAKYDVFSPSPVQSFPVQLDLEGLGAKVDKLVVRSRENWGHPDYVCLYRVRAHGTLVHPERTAMLT